MVIFDGLAVVIFTDHCDLHLKLPVSGMYWQLISPGVPVLIILNFHCCELPIKSVRLGNIST